MIKSKRKLMFVLIAFIVLIGLLGAVLGIAWYQDAIYTPPSTSSELIDFEVDAGSSLLDITPQLQKQGIIKSTDALRIYLRLNNISPTLLKGKYQLTSSQNIPDLLKRLAEGPKVYSVKVTLPEALRADEIVSIIVKAYAFDDITLDEQLMLAIIASPDSQAFSTANKEFLATYKPAGKNLEGFLFPDTYILGADATELQIIELLVTTMRQRLVEAGIDTSSVASLGSFYEVLTLASIVEREANSNIDRKLVADIFLRRLENGWMLGSDVCLLYYFKDWTRELTRSDLEDSGNPYNTRLMGGLTPTPISNPGLSGIQAVLEPTPNDYFYFIAGNDGNNYYAKTLAEHNQNVANYL